MPVSLVKAHGRHAQCTTWQLDGPPCVGHGTWCDRVVYLDGFLPAFHAEEGRTIPVLGNVWPHNVVTS